MPKIIDLRRRIFMTVLTAPNQMVSKRQLHNATSKSYRPMLDEQISDMLSTGILVQIGLGVRGMPIKYVLGARFPLPLCPVCKSPISPITHPELFTAFKKYLTKKPEPDTKVIGGDNVITQQ